MRGERLSQHVSGIAPLNGALDGTPRKARRAPAKSSPKPAVETIFACHCGQRFDDLREAWIHVRAEYADLREVLGALRKSNGTRLVAECGTPSGYRRHLRRKESICDACRDAYNAQERELRADPEYREKRNARERERLRARRRDPEWREKVNARQRERRAADPEYREKVAARDRERRADPEYREKAAARDRERRADPEYREKDNARKRDPEYREKANARARERRADPEYREKDNARARERRARKKSEGGRGHADHG